MELKTDNAFLNACREQGLEKRTGEEIKADVLRETDAAISALYRADLDLIQMTGYDAEEAGRLIHSAIVLTRRALGVMKGQVEAGDYP